MKQESNPRKGQLSVAVFNAIIGRENKQSSLLTALVSHHHTVQRVHFTVHTVHTGISKAERRYVIWGKLRKKLSLLGTDRLLPCHNRQSKPLSFRNRNSASDQSVCTMHVWTSGLKKRRYTLARAAPSKHLRVDRWNNARSKYTALHDPLILLFLSFLSLLFSTPNRKHSGGQGRPTPTHHINAASLPNSRCIIFSATVSE